MKMDKKTIMKEEKGRGEMEEQRRRVYKNENNWEASSSDIM